MLCYYRRKLYCSMIFALQLSYVSQVHTIFHWYGDVFTQSLFLNKKRVPFDDFLVTPWVQENKSERQKEPQIPNPKAYTISYVCQRIKSEFIWMLDIYNFALQYSRDWSLKFATLINGHFKTFFIHLLANCHFEVLKGSQS